MKMIEGIVEMAVIMIIVGNKEGDDGNRGRYVKF